MLESSTVVQDICLDEGDAVTLKSIVPLAALLVSPVLAYAQTTEELPDPSAPALSDSAPSVPSIGDASKLLGPLPSLELEQGDGRRTMGRYLPNLGRNLIGVWSTSNAKPFALGVAAAGVGTLLDDPAKNYF